MDPCDYHMAPEKPPNDTFKQRWKYCLREALGTASSYRRSVVTAFRQGSQGEMEIVPILLAELKQNNFQSRVSAIDENQKYSRMARRKAELFDSFFVLQFYPSHTRTYTHLHRFLIELIPHPLLSHKSSSIDNK